MNPKLDSNFRIWLENLSRKWKMSVEQLTLTLAGEEINNRVQNYPKVSSALKMPLLNIEILGNVLPKCWAVGEQHVLIHLGDFVRKRNTAVQTIRELTDNFPQLDTEASKRINNFTVDAARLGFTTPDGSRDLAGALSLASVILSSLYPMRFVDFAQKRWKDLAKTFGYPSPSSKLSRGELLLWASNFAREVSVTRTYREYWPLIEPRYSNPLWVLSGISWVGSFPKKPKQRQEPFDPESASFPEGAEKRYLHLARERSRTLVANAKTVALQDDPMLHCLICGFSFLERYGERGRGFVEAHHKVPVSELKAGSRTRIEDIALVCANCHRMLHYGDRTLTSEELRKLLIGQPVIVSQ